MGTSKTESYNPKEIEIAELLKAIAHPARLAILQALAKRKTCVCGDLVDALPLAQATVSQHLKAMKNVGLIQGTVTGTQVCYCLNPKAFEKVKAYISKIDIQLNTTKICC